MKTDRKATSISSEKKKAWKLFSEYIRQRDANWKGWTRCCTCGKAGHWKTMQAGHFVGGRHSNILFDLRNCHAQCYRCNCLLHGNLINYYPFMLKKYGQEIIDDLKKRDKTLKKFTLKELEILINSFKVLLQDIEGGPKK